jgi:hypothetical protein
MPAGRAVAACSTYGCSLQHTYGCRQHNAVDAVLFEVARRLLGRRYGDSKR